MLFHKKLGSYRDKARAHRAARRGIARDVFGRPDAADARRHGGRLAKADLTTDMVFEFPELQGTMGGIYAREEGQPEQVWKAIYYQYLPIGVEADAPPSTAQLGAAASTWAAVSLADKLDTVVGLFSAGEKSTGSRDPFGLRRQMHGIVRILMDLPELTGINTELGVRELIGTAERGFGAPAASPWRTMRARLRARARALCDRAAGQPNRESCGRATPRRATSCPCARAGRGSAAADARASEDFQALAVLFKRVKNIAKERKIGRGARSLGARGAGGAGAARRARRSPAEHRAGVGGSGLQARLRGDGRPASGRRSILHRGLRHGRRRARAGRAARV